MKLKKKKTLEIFFMIQNLSPTFFELLIGSVKDFNKNVAIKNKRILKLRQSNKTITLFPVYLNLFSTKKINTQENEKQVYVNINRVDLKKKNQDVLSKVIAKRLEPRYKISFIGFYLSRSNKVGTLQVIKSTKILQNLKMI